MRALLRKEGREHRWFLLLLYLVGGVLLGGFWIEARNTISPLTAWDELVQKFGTLAAVLVANRFVMREYGARTQLFLEALPIGRGSVLATKWLAGWLALMLFFVPAFGIALFAARERVYLGGGLPVAIALRSVVYLLFVYAGAFAVTLTLRLRFVVWAVLLVCAFMLDGGLQLPIREWPPFALVKPSMALEAQLPWRDLGITAGLSLGLAAAALLLALAVRGALPVVLAQPMSARARTLAAFVFAGFLALSTLLEKRVPPPPFRLEQAISNPGDPSVHVGWRQDVAGMPPAQLAARIAADTAAMRDWLGLQPLAQVWLVPDAWREPDEIGEAAGSPGQLVVRAALGAPDLSLPQLQEVVRVAHIRSQAPALGWREDRGWLLWGFAAWWGAARDEARQALLRRRFDAAARLLRAHGLDAGAALRRSDTAEELLGDCLNDAFAWRAVQALHERLGPQGFQALMRALLVGPGSDDLNALVKLRSAAGLLEQAGLPLPALAQAIGQDEERSAIAPAFDVRAVRQGGGMFALHYQVAGAVPPGLAVRYKVLRPMEPEVRPENTAWAGGAASGVLPATFASGVRVFVMADAFDPALGCRYRLGVVRQEVR